MKSISAKNIPDLIRSDNYYDHIQNIKSYEDTIRKLFETNIESHLTSDSNVFLWNATNNSDILSDMCIINLSEFGIMDKLENIVIMGPYVRSCFLNRCDNKHVRKEIYMYRCDGEWNNIISNFDDFVDEDDRYVYSNKGKKVFLMKKPSKSLASTILQNDYLKRIGLYNNEFYVSSMFMIEFQKHKKKIKHNFKDPIMGRMYDPLKIYKYQNTDLTNPINIIEYVDIDKFNKIILKSNKIISKSDKINKIDKINKMYGKKTLIELCIDRYMKENHTIICENIENMILELSKNNPIRPPIYYAQMMCLDKKNKHLYDILYESSLCTTNDIINTIPAITPISLTNTKQKNNTITSIDDINDTIINDILKKDDPNEFLKFMVLIEKKIDKKIIELLIQNDSINISIAIITNNLLEKQHEYYLCFMIGVIKTDIDIDIEIAINFLKDIVSNGIVNSFIYLLERDKSILDITFDNGMNILHMMQPKNGFKKIIDIIMNIKPQLINLRDSNGNTPIIHHSKYNPKVFEHLINYDFDITIYDLNENMCIHHICKLNEPQILKKILLSYPSIIDMPNSQSEYPIIICSKYGLEELFYILKSFGANMKVIDEYGNTAYHYVCANTICLGTTIINTQNYFGITPENYCKVSTNYYSFVS